MSLTTPRPTSAAELTAGGWTTNATAAATVAAGGKVTIAAHVTAATNRGALVDVEVYSPSGAKVFQQFWDNQSFVAGVQRSFTATWTVPAGQSGGQHVVKIGIFRSGWAALQHWNDSASKITVTTGSTTTTSTTAPTTTTPPPTTTVPPSSTSTTVTSVTSTTAAPTTTVPPPGGVQFRATFATPADFYDRFDFGMSGLDRAAAQPGHVWPGDHNHACQGPTTVRDVHINVPAEWFWWCAPNGPDTGHMMTSFDTSGYNIVWFSPKGWFRNVRSVCWDQNVTWLGGGKWTQTMVITRADVEAQMARNGGRLDLGFTGPGFQDSSGPTTGVHFQPGTASVGTRFFGGNFDFWSGWPSVSYGDQFDGGNNFHADKAARYRHCLVDNENGTVTLTQVRPGGATRTETIPGALPNGDVRVVFQDDTYDGIKHGGVPDAKTWHWDNIEIT